MAGMPGVAQPVDNPEIEIFKMMPALARDVVDIRGIGGITDAITERWYIAVTQNKRRKRHRTALPFDRAALTGFDEVTVQDRRVVAFRWRHKTIGKPQQDLIGGRLAQIDRKAAALMQHDGTQIVDAVGLVGMLMRQKYRVNVIDLGVDQLLAQIGRGINQDSRNSAIPRALDEQRAAPAAVFRIVGIACTPAKRGTRNAGGGPAAENCKRQRHAAGTLENRWKKFCVV